MTIILSQLLVHCTWWERLVDGKEEIMLVSKQGNGIRVKCSDISVIGRATQGVRVMRLEENDSLAAAAKIVVEDGEEGKSSEPVQP